MVLNIQKLLRSKAEPEIGVSSFDISNHDFPGFRIEKPVQLQYEAVPEGDAVRLTISLKAEVATECARCLEPLIRSETIEKTYMIRANDLAEEFPDLPFVDGKLSLEEFTYTELVLEVPAVIVCSEDCLGLCVQCGKPKEVCQCEPQEEGDPRLQILKQLLT